MTASTNLGLELSVTDFAANVTFFAALAELLQMQLVAASPGYRCWRNAAGAISVRERDAGPLERAMASWPGLPHKVCILTEMPQVVDAVHQRMWELRAVILLTPEEYLRHNRHYGVVFATPEGMQFEVRYEPRPPASATADASTVPDAAEQEAGGW